MRLKRVSRVVCVVAGLALSSIDARASDAPGEAPPTAEPPSNVREAERLFVTGRLFMDRGDYAAACGRFEESLKLDPAAVGTILNLGLCYQGQRKYATALAHFRTVAVQSAQAVPERAELALKHIAEVEPRVSFMRVVVPEPAREPGLVVRIDGRELGVEQWGAELAADGGDHVVEATAPGRKPLSVRFALELERGRGLVTLTPLEKMPDTRGLGYATLGGGVAVFAVGLGLGISVAAQCGGLFKDTCEAADKLAPPRRDEKLSSLDTQAWIANIGVGVGVVAMALGTYWVVTSPHARQEKPRPIGFVPLVTPFGGGGAMRGAF